MDVPDLIDIPYACHFAPRCPESDRECFEMEPPFPPVNSPDHEAACLKRGAEPELAPGSGPGDRAGDGGERPGPEVSDD